MNVNHNHSIKINLFAKIGEGMGENLDTLMVKPQIIEL